MATLAEPVRRFDLGLSWRAIFVGLVVGLSAQFLLTLLGLAIGLSTIDITGSNTNAQGVGIGAAIWALVVPIISWFLGAYSASYASGVYNKNIGVLHGMTTWGLGLMCVLFLLGSGISNAVSATFGVIGTTAQTLSQSGLVKRSDLQQLQRGDVQQKAQQQLNQVNSQDAQRAARDAAKGAWAAFAAAILSFGAACLGGAAGSRVLMGRFGDVERRDRETPMRPPIIQTPRTT